MARPIRVGNSLAGLAVVLLATLAICLPFAQYVSWTGDEGILPHAASRLMRGEALYRDFFEFHPPGGFLIVQAWMAMVGSTVLALRWLGIGSILAVAVMSYLAANRASRNPAIAVILVLAWAISSQGVWTQLNHHWFATMLSLTVAWCALDPGDPANGRIWPALVAGAAAGTGAMITQHQGALTCLAGLVAFTSFKVWRSLAAYLVGCSIAPLCLLGYILANGAMMDAYKDVILFTLSEYRSVQTVAYGSGADHQTYPLLWVFPAAGVTTCAALALNLRSLLTDRRIWVCIATGLAGFLACFPRPDIPHLAFATPLALPLVATSTARLIGGWRLRRQLIVLAVVVVVGLPSAWNYAKLVHKVNALPKTKVGGDRNELAFANQSIAAVIPEIAETPPGDRYLFYPYMPLMPVLTGHPHVAQIDIFLPRYTTPKQYYDACIATMRSADWAVVDHEWTDPDFLARIFPHLRDLSPTEARQFNAALAKGFVSEAKSGKVELLKRGPAASGVLCAPILTKS